MLRAKPPPSKWLVAPGPRRKNSHWKPIHGRRQSWSAGCIETGCVQRVLDVDLEVVLEVLPDAGQVGHDRHAECLELGR